MHSSVLLVTSLLSCYIFANPLPASADVVNNEHHPQLARRFITAPITIPVGSVGVDMNLENRRVVEQLQDRVKHLRDEVTFLKGREQMLQGGPGRLQRRQIGTILGSVGIHKSNNNRKFIGDMNNQVGGMRVDVDWMLQSERLGPATTAMLGDMGHQEHGGSSHDMEFEEGEEDFPEESGPDDIDEFAPVPVSNNHPRLQRRFLGMILAPIAVQQAKDDRVSIEQLRTRVELLQADCARIRTAQEKRLQFGTAGLVSTSTTIAGNRFGDNRVIATTMGAPGLIEGGVLGAHATRPFMDGMPNSHTSAFVPRHGRGSAAPSHHSTSYGGSRRY